MRTLTVAFLFAVSFAGCGRLNGPDANRPSGIVVVNAPVAGQVRRVLVNEGSAVTPDTPILEISIQPAQVAGQSTPDAATRARNSYRAAEGGIAEARSEAERAAVEVQRVSSLVSSGSAPQSQLDAARAQYQAAQQKLQNAEAAARGAEARIAAPQTSSNVSSTPAVEEQIVTVRAGTTGTVGALNATPGQQVTLGQPLATVSVGAR
jgi:multidrug resistance efflux pump